MKSLQTLLITFSLFLTISANAQIVNIPDAKFKNALVNSLCVDNDGDLVAEADVDSNNDGEIQLSEALAVKGLKVVNKQIDSLNGVEQFTNLEVLDFATNKVKSVDIHALTNLKKLWCDINNLTFLDLAGLTNLRYLNCATCKLVTLNVQGLTNLEEIWASGNKLTNLNVSGLTALKILRCSSNQLTGLNPQGLVNLQYLDFSTNQVASVNVQGLTNLEYLICNYTPLAALNVQGLTKLLNVTCSASNITSLNLQNLPNLRDVNCVYAQLVDLNVHGCYGLQHLDLNNNYLTTLDVSDLHNLTELDCTNNQLVYLNIKNGSTEIFGLYFSGNPGLQYICCDENQLIAVKTKATQGGLANCVVGDYCSFAPGEVFYRFQGQNKVDYNNNGCDNADGYYPNLKYSISSAAGTQTFICNNAGFYNFPLVAGSYTIVPVFEHPNYFTAQPAVFQVSLPADTNLLNQNQCLLTTGIHHDLEITLLPIRHAAPGFNARYQLTYKNKGNQVESGKVKISFDEDRMNFVSAEVMPDEQTNGNLIWNYSDLFPLELRKFEITFHINSPSESLPVNVGDKLSIDASIESLGADETPIDNFSGLRQTVVGAIDPNDKTCLEGDTISSDLIGKYLHYLIRFENTGTYAAENIVVKDVIDLSKFDISTLQIISSSHACYARIRNNNQVEFIFENINLPFTEPDKHGFVAFKIKSKPNLTVGSTLSNQADIFFDYNLPVTTNKAITLIHNTVGTHVPASNVFSLQIQPNPAQDVLYLDSEMPLEQVEIFDALGRLALQTAVENGQINIARLGHGTYFLKAYGRNGVVEGRMVKE